MDLSPDWVSRARALFKELETFCEKLEGHGDAPAPPPPTPVPDPPPPARVWSLETRDGVIEVQKRLTELGYLCPPADGGWGPVSKWALGALCEDNQKLWIGGGITAQAQEALSDGKPLPIVYDSSFASKVIRAMRACSDFVARHSDCVNIVYVRGVEPDGTPNAHRFNTFSDARLVIRIGENGVPKMAGAWEGTTEPGRYWTIHRMNPRGAFHIRPGQYKAWCHGYHHTHEAWVQRGEIEGYRDANCDMITDFTSDKLVKGSNFGVNQHWGYDLPVNNLANSSAGCLVGRTTAGHREFMRITKEDARYKANHNYMILTSILSAADVYHEENK